MSDPNFINRFKSPRICLTVWPGRIFPHQTESLVINIFNIYDNAAKLLFRKFPPANNVDTVSQDAKPVHILVAGFGKYGESVALQA